MSRRCGGNRVSRFSFMTGSDQRRARAPRLSLQTFSIRRLRRLHQGGARSPLDPPKALIHGGHHHAFACAGAAALALRAGLTRFFFGGASSVTVSAMWLVFLRILNA